MSNSQPNPLVFLKTERLRSRKYANILIQRGQYKRYPYFIVRYLFVLPDKPLVAEWPFVQVFFSIPKRLILQATKRHRLKRIMTEAYRLHKAPLMGLGSETHCLLIGYRYTASTMVRYSPLAAHIQDSIQWISDSSHS